MYLDIIDFKAFLFANVEIFLLELSVNVNILQLCSTLNKGVKLKLLKINRLVSLEVNRSELKAQLEKSSLNVGKPP